MGKSVAVCLDNFRRWGTNPRIYVLAVLILLMQETMMVGSVRNFSYWVNVPVAPWIYPFLTADWYLCMLEALGAVMLFCDAPFMNEGTPYLFVRTGRTAWLGGQILYIIAAAAIYQLFFVAAGILLLSPHMIWTLDWGKVLGTLAQTDAGYANGIAIAGSMRPSLILCKPRSCGRIKQHGG